MGWKNKKLERMYRDFCRRNPYGSEREYKTKYGWVALYKRGTIDFFWTRRELREKYEGAMCCCKVVRVKLVEVKSSK